MSLSKELQLKFTNILHHVHDLACNCKNPLIHSTKLILTQLNSDLTTEERKELQKCLGSTQEEDATGAAELDFGEDLETLFADDIDDATTG